MDNRASLLVVLPDIQQQDVGVFPGEAFYGGLDFVHMGDAKWARAFGIQQASKLLRLPNLTHQENANLVSVYGHGKTSRFLRQRTRVGPYLSMQTRGGLSDASAIHANRESAFWKGTPSVFQRGKVVKVCAH
jgi:hypothetical protein